MYGSIVEAAVRDKQRARLAHAADVRRVHAAFAAPTTAPDLGREPRRLAAWHPRLSFHRWLAAGQL